MKTLIAVPCMDQVSALFAQSLAMLNKTENTIVGFQISSLIYTARNDFAKTAISQNADAMLFLDSDVTFEPDTLAKMEQHIKDGKDIVTGIYFKRRKPFSPVLYEKLDYNWDTNECSWVDLPDIPESKELFEVAGAGMGCCMISKTVLLDVLLNYQTWFSPMGNVGEDLAFCIRARELGYKIWCDPTISLGHVGQLVINEAVWRTMTPR